MEFPRFPDFGLCRGREGRNTDRAPELSELKRQTSLDARSGKVAFREVLGLTDMKINKET